MSDPTPTRQETVEANIEALAARWGDEDSMHMIKQMLMDIAVNTAIIADNSGTST